MKCLVVAFITLGAVLAAPLTLTDQQTARLREVMGANANVTAAKIIIIDEAAAIGIPAEQHWKTCIDGSDDVWSLSEAEQDAIAAELMEKGSGVVFRSTDEILPVLKAKLPKTHSFVIKAIGDNYKLYDDAVAELKNDDGRKFLTNVKTAALEGLVALSEVRNQPRVLLKKAAKMISRISIEWDALSKEAKQEIEVNMCLRTAFRLLEQAAEDNEMKPFLFLLLLRLSAAAPELILSDEQTARLRQAIVTAMTINATAARQVIAEEASALGLTTQQHWTTCFGENTTSPSLVTDAEATEIAVELNTLGYDLVFNENEEVLFVIKSRLPKTYAVVVRVLGENFTKYDEAVRSVDNDEAREWLVEIKRAVLLRLVFWSKAGDDQLQRMRRITVFFTVHLLWNDLDDSAKAEIEKKMCLRSAFRLLGGQMADLRKQTGDMIDQIQRERDRLADEADEAQLWE